MNRCLASIALAVTALYIQGCASPIVKISAVPHEAQSLDIQQGAVTLTSVKTNVVIVTALSDIQLGDSLPAFYVMVANNTDEPFLFSPENIEATFDGDELPVYAYEQLLSDATQRKNAMIAAAALGAAGQAVAASQPAKSYNSGTVNSHGAVGNTPFAAQNSLAMNTTTFNPATGAQANQAIIANMTQQMQLIAAQSSLVAASFDSLLRENSIRPGQTAGGVVRMKMPLVWNKPEPVRIVVTTPNEQHEFNFTFRRFSNSELSH